MATKLQDVTADAADVFSHVRNLEGRLDGFGDRLTGVERSMSAMAKENRQSAGILSDKIDQLARAVSVQQARPDFNVREMLQVVSVCVFLFTAAAGGIVTLATYVAAGSQAKTDERVATLKERLDKWERIADKMTDRMIDRQLFGALK